MRQALRVGLLYLLVAAVWIYVSDRAVEALAGDPETIGRLQTWKGWGFVFVSATFLAALVHREIRKVNAASARLDVLVEQPLAGIYLIRSGRFLYVNSTLAAAFGYDREEMVEGLEVADVVAEEDRERVLRRLRLREEGQEEAMRYRFTGLRKDGSEVRVEVHGAGIEWEGKRAVLGVLLDVDERERLEQQVREAQRMETMGRLTGQIAHDFNNLLTGVIGPLDLCLDQLERESDARLDAEQARDSAVRAATLSRKLLAFSRRRVRVTRTLDVNETLMDLRALIDRLVGATVSVRYALDPEPCLVELDPTELEQVVMNLTLNAGEAIEDGGTVTVRTGRAEPERGPAGSERGRPEAGTGAPSEHRVRLEVEDDGVGMDPETSKRIFEPFFTTKRSGTGLGLATVFGIVERAGGTVELDTEEGLGSLFRVLLPAARGEPEPARPEPSEDVQPTGGGGERILVIDDEPAVLSTVTRTLERFGYEVLGARSGEEALSLSTGGEGSIDLLLTDVSLPDILGPEVAERITESRPGVRVLYMSGFSNREVSDRLSRATEFRLIEKPFTVDDLLACVRETLAAGSGSA